MTNPPGLPKYRHRKFKAVIHNVRQDSDTIIDRFITQFKQPIIKSYTSIEPYTHQDGFHLHIYFEFKNQIWFHSLLKLLKDLSTIIRSEVLPQLPGQAGRVDLKPWSSGQTWTNIEQYLVNPIKDKEVGILHKHKTSYCWCKLGLNPQNICPIFQIPLISKHILTDKCIKLREHINSLPRRPPPDISFPPWFEIPGPPGQLEKKS